MLVQDQASPMNYNPVFIIGVQRSGTTLLRLILNAHSEIAIPEEARFLSPILKKDNINKKYKGNELRNLVRYLKSNSQFALWNFDTTDFFRKIEKANEISVKELVALMFTSYCKSEGKNIWGDKSLFFGSIDILHELFPDARFIHIVRDGRDVFDSWRRMDPSKDNPAVMSLDWATKEKNIAKSFNRIPGNKQLTIKYEDLLEQPEEVVKSICEFLDINYEINMLECYKSSDRYIGKHHSTLIFNKIDSQNTHKWRKTLSAREIAIFTALSRSLLNNYDYETADISPGLVDRVSMIYMLVSGLPYRLAQILMNKARYTKALKQGTDVTGLSTGELPREKQ